MDIDGFALVIGSGSGIGKACALGYAKEGAAGVCFADININAAEDAAEASRLVSPLVGYKALSLKVDITKPESVQHMVDMTIESFGRIDYAVNSAGIGATSSAEIADASVSEFERFMSVNATGTMIVARTLSRAMKMQSPKAHKESARPPIRGVITLMASAASYAATPGLAHYTASKHAVLGITKTAALDNINHGIRTNCVCPVWVKTPMVEKALEGVGDLQALIDRVLPLKRLAEPEEVADVIMFLSSPRASYVNGASWMIDGGATLQVHI